jgi:integrase
MNIRQEVQKSETKRKRSAPRYWVEIKGRLYARLQYKAESGKYQVKYKPISDKRTAKRAVEEMRKELETHSEKMLLSDKMTFFELAERYEQVKLVPAAYQNGVKISGKRSIAPVKSALNPLFAYFGQKTIRSIKASDIEAYKTERLNSPVKREINVKIKNKDENGKSKFVRQKEKKSTPRKLAGINRELALLRIILNFAVQNEWLIKNPFVLAKGVISMSAEVERDRVLSFDEESRLLSVCSGARAHLKPLLICALDTAMRRGEMFKMCWRDINFDRNEIFIPQTNTKSEDARTVGMTPRLKEELKLLWEISPKNLESIVFGITNTIKTAWKTACRLADIKDFRFHDCRHTATTRMIASGSPHTEVMKITGHSQLKTFLRYLNITSETANSVALRLDSYVSKRQIQPSKISVAIN